MVEQTVSVFGRVWMRHSTMPAFSPPLWKPLMPVSKNSIA